LLVLLARMVMLRVLPHRHAVDRVFLDTIVLLEAQRIRHHCVLLVTTVVVEVEVEERLPAQLVTIVPRAVQMVQLILADLAATALLEALMTP